MNGSKYSHLIHFVANVNLVDLSF